LEIKELLSKYRDSPVIRKLTERLQGEGKYRLMNNAGSVTAVLVSAMIRARPGFRVVVLNDREEAAYFYNDVLAFVPEEQVAFLPSSYRRYLTPDEKDNDSVLVRTEVLKNLANGRTKVLVTYPEALAERVVGKSVLEKMSMTVRKGDALSLSFLEDLLTQYDFVRSDFVFEPGQFAVRGSLVDVYSYAEERPVRIDFFGDEVESVRFFDVETQLSEQPVEETTIVPDLSNNPSGQARASLFEYFPEKPVWWIRNGLFMYDHLQALTAETEPGLLTGTEELFGFMERCSVVEWGPDMYFRGTLINAECEAQPAVNKQFDLLADLLQQRQADGYQICICSVNSRQIDRLRDIFSDKGFRIDFTYVEGVIHEGFSDRQLKLCVYTEHQLFDRYHKYRLQTTRIRKGRESITVSELQNLHPGDYVVHVDHGIGRFGGLVKINNNGKEQEAIRLVYKNNSELYVSLHALHKISKYKGKDGEPPVVNRLGGSTWNRLKQKTKSRVKDIARELIALYAKRKEERAFAFSKDSYLQEEMEASFVYEETPDQMKAIEAVKEDMERAEVMDRLICGDVGFGKTEVAMRAAFKAVADSKQVAVLVPTTVLAYQHYNTFVKRMEGLPCRIEYVSRMKRSSDIKRVLQELAAGKVDIVIGTHRLIGKDVIFKDLGLLIIDEEQKFGVGAKEKLKQLKLNVDTMTMTATPIPRTLQFSLMGARDMSIIRTPPSNRYPIVTELHRFDEKLIREAVLYEMERNGQVFFIHNRIDTIRDVQTMLHRLIPEVKSCVVHGQMSGDELEQTMHDFIRGDHDVLIATTIVESGLDIPNANTIIINQAQNYGLSDLHQLRGRVGRSNRKAFCYLMTPSLDLMNPDARRRLKAIEDFSGLGSGFNIAMQDLDIRGAGNVLGAEQSGFISEIGYETYQRILNEALLELRDEEFPDLQTGGTERQRGYVTDCVVDSDFEVLIPEEYVENVSERIRLYRELDNISEEEELDLFAGKMKDRFGQLPPQVLNLLEIVRIRRKSMELGIERLSAKNGRMTMFFISDPASSFYKSTLFTDLLQFVRQQPLPCRLSEHNQKLSLSFTGVESVETMSRYVGKMHKILIAHEPVS
jgi:transcription-repair coupling factor (superfamily II helicase)